MREHARNDSWQPGAGILREQSVHDRVARLAWFKSIVLPHEAALRKHVRRLVTPDLDVDDVVSESLTRAYAADDWQRITNGRSYLFRIARNLLVDAARRRAVVSFEVMADLEALNIADDAPSADAIVSAREELRRLEDVVDGLPPRCRQVFLLRRIHDHSLNEIAVELNVSVSTVEKHLARAMELVTRALAESDPVPSTSMRLAWRRAKDRR